MIESFLKELAHHLVKKFDIGVNYYIVNGVIQYNVVINRLWKYILIAPFIKIYTQKALEPLNYKLTVIYKRVK
jgi:hypothetical protein